MFQQIRMYPVTASSNLEHLEKLACYIVTTVPKQKYTAAYTIAYRDAGTCESPINLQFFQKTFNDSSLQGYTWLFIHLEI